ncbi:MAG: flagellar hook-associated protein FlgL [Bacillota bacterium]
MRVTQNMLVNNLLYQLRLSQDRLVNLQNQIASGRRIHAPSDDPVATVKVLEYRAIKADITQYKGNAEMGIEWLGIAGNALEQATQGMQRVRELAVAGASSSLPAGSREALALEVEQLREEMVQVASTKYRDKYVFSGLLIDRPPFDASSTYQGDLNTVETEVAAGITVGIGLPGDGIFGTGATKAGKSIFQVLDDLASDLRAGNHQLVGNARLAEVAEIEDTILSHQAIIGSRMNRLEKTIDRLTDTWLKVEDLLSRRQDTDIPAAVTELATLEAAYRSSLMSTARIIQPTLLEFLR